MRLVHVVFVSAAIWAVHDYAQKNDLIQGYASYDSTQGFVALIGVQNQAPDTVYVIAPPNCPSEEGQRATRLVEALKQRGVPVAQSSGVRQIFDDIPTLEELGRLEALTKHPAPLVVINGRAKPNPTLDEVIAEFDQSSRW